VESDLLRRDFTINSMAVNLDSGELVDPFSGADDLDARKLRTTHPASFKEDPSRLARALVMTGRYGLQPDEKTRQQMVENAHRIGLESPDAVQPILDKLLTSRDPARGVRLARDTGILKHLLPEVDNHWDFDQNNPHHKHTLGEHQIGVLENVASQTGDPDLRMMALLHDIGKPDTQGDRGDGFNNYHGHEQVGAQMAEKRLRALRWPAGRIKRITHLIEQHMFPDFSQAKGARKFIQRVGDDHANDLLTFRWADHAGKGDPQRELEARAATDQMRGLVEQARSVQAPTSQSALAINGNDVLGLGVKPGPQVGQILRRLTDDVVDDPHLNDRAALLQRAQEYANAIPGS
jgi:tRNA nucleotidyltransferase (CCA-adding enzyme)